LREKKDELLLRELLGRWSNHKFMTRFLTRIFRYLDRYYISRHGLPSLEEIGFLSFYHLVGDEIPLKCYTTVLFPDFILLSSFFPFLTRGFTSFYLSQVYDELNGQVMDAILAMVFYHFHFYAFL
jgi:hypothetical protein